MFNREFKKRKYNSVWHVLNASNDEYDKYNAIEGLIDGLLDETMMFQTANAEYEQMLKDFECSLTPKQQKTLLRLKAKANDVHIGWLRLQSPYYL